MKSIKILNLILITLCVAFATAMLANPIAEAYHTDLTGPLVALAVGGALVYFGMKHEGPLAYVVSPIVSALTAYAGTHEKALFNTMINGLDIANDVTVVPNVKYKQLMTKLTVAAGVRPFSSTFSAPGSELTYTDRTLEVKAAKRELQIDPEKYRTTYLSEQMSPGTNANKAEIPFAQYTWEKVMEGIARDVNDSAAYLGVYNSSGTASVDICDGLGTIIATEITNTNLTVTATGAITNANAVSKFELMYKALPIAYQNTNTILYCSYTNFFNYVENYRSTYGANMDFSGLLGEGSYLKISGKKCEIRPCTWMGTSGRVIVTPKANLLMGTDLLSDMNQIKINPAMWTIDAGVKFVIGFQIRDLSAIKINDVA